jgi:hypothetical protein
MTVTQEVFAVALRDDPGFEFKFSPLKRTSHLDGYYPTQPTIIADLLKAYGTKQMVLKVVEDDYKRIVDKLAVTEGNLASAEAYIREVKQSIKDWIYANLDPQGQDAQHLANLLDITLTRTFTLTIRHGSGWSKRVVYEQTLTTDDPEFDPEREAQYILEGINSDDDFEPWLDFHFPLPEGVVTVTNTSPVFSAQVEIDASAVFDKFSVEIVEVG